MANIKFITSERSDIESELTIYANQHYEIFIEIYMKDEMPSHICLDKETAELFLKKLTEELCKLD